MKITIEKYFLTLGTGDSGENAANPISDLVDNALDIATNVIDGVQVSLQQMHTFHI